MDDDDFGDLYADVELQVKSTINTNTPAFTKVYTEIKPEQEPEENNNNNDDDSSNKNHISNTSPEVLQEDDGSDSEDDLNIVLNDEDSKVFPVTAARGGVGGGGFDKDENGLDQIVGHGLDSNSKNSGHGYASYSQYKGLRNHGSLFPSTSRSGWEDTGCNQHKGANSGQIASNRAAANSIVCQYGYGFSLPWYRTILDVNIDTFEEKPWTHPGANISDFFNYGFSEDSWKRYCNSLDQFRNHTFTQARSRVFDSSKSNQAYEVGSEHEKIVQEAVAEDSTQVRSSSKFPECEERPFKLPKGRAIEVEDSIGERQPSMDVRRPRFRASDVVIQINLQASAKDFSGSGKEELGHIDSSSSDHETSENGDIDVDHNNCFGTASGDELSADSLEKDVRNLDKSFALRRYSDFPENSQISDGDGCSHRKVKVHSSEEMSEAIGTLKKAEVVGRNTCKSDSCLMETESSHANRSHFSLSLSCSGSDSEASKDSFLGDPVKICNLSPNSGSKLQEPVTSDHKKSKSNDFKTKPGDRKYSLQHRSPSRENWKHHSRHRRGFTEQKIYPTSDDDASHMSNGKGEDKSYLRYGHGKRKWKHCRGTLHSASERDIHPEKGYDASLISEAEGFYDRDYRSADCIRRKERLCDFDYRDGEDFSYNRETGLSSGYRRGRFGDNNIRAVHRERPHWKSHQRFRDQTDPYVRKKWRERVDSCERSARVDNEDDVDRDGYHFKRGLFTGERIPLPYEESRRLVSKYSSTFKERDTEWRSNSDTLQFLKRIDHDGSLLDYNQEDDFLQEKYGRSVSFTDRERGSLDRMYQREWPFIGREVRMSVQRERQGDSPHFHLDRSWSMEIEDRYQRHTYHQSSTSLSYRKCYTVNGRRWHDNAHLVDDDVDDSILTERYWRHRRHICDEDGDIGQFGTYDDTNDTNDRVMDYDDLVHQGRRRNIWHSEELHRIEDELVAEDWDNELFTEKASLSYEETSMHGVICPRYESDRDGVLIDDMKLDHHRYKFTREGSSSNRVSENDNIVYKGEHEHTVPRCRDPVDSIVGEGKSSGRWSDGRSSMGNCRLKKMDLKPAKKPRYSKNFHESDRGKAANSTDILEVESNENIENWLDKFPVTEHNEELDIEEGQIITEEPNRKDVPVSTAANRNVNKTVLHSENTSNQSKVVVEEIDSQRILATRAKMEKRRERFKDPISKNKELDMNPKPPQADLMVDTAENKQQRPARKRRWGGKQN